MVPPPTPPPSQLGYPKPEERESGLKRHEQLYETSESLKDPVVLRVRCRQLASREERH